MIRFKEIQPTDKPAMDRRLAASGIPSCDYTFANIYCWRHTYGSVWAEFDDIMAVRFELGAEGYRGYMLSEQGDYCRIVPELMEDARAEGMRFRMVGMSRDGAEAFRRWADAHYGLDAEGHAAVCGTDGERLVRRGSECFAVCDNRDYRDYIYSLEDLVNLTGRKYQPKRNHVNRFEAMYEYTFDELRPADFGECMRLEREWQRRKEAAEAGDTEHRAEHETEMSEEQRAIAEALAEYDRLGLYGGVLRVDGRVVAFTYGSELTPEIFCTHIEKADASFEGVFPMINRCFARALAARGYKFVNREEDMGLTGLRRSKMSYHPAAMQEKMTVLALTLREMECRELWKRVFGDEREFVDLFLSEVYRPENTLVRYAEGHVAAMLHIVDIATKYGPTGYLYAIATDPARRGRGLASELVTEAVALLRERGYKAAMLIPSEPSLKEFYARFGFEDREYPLDFSEGFDLGTGDAARDRAMVLEI